MAALHVDNHGGAGAPLLFIHGWGMHGGMWGGVPAQLAQHAQVRSVDLPGHGYSTRIEDQGSRSEDTELRIADCGFRREDSAIRNPKSEIECSALRTPHSALDLIVDQLADQFAGPLTLCGWSLGGQVALRWAQRYPEQVSRMVLVSSTPCFVQQAGWPCAMAADTLAAFAAALLQDYAQTLRRFLALQVRGGEQERELLASLRRLLPSRGEPDPTALQSGLEILRDVDLRDALPQISQPVLVIAGDRDTLTPMAASQYLAAHLPAARLATIEGAAHASFLSHRDEFVELVIDFLNNN